MRFSQRQGLTPVRKVAQKDSIDSDLRNGLWNALTLMYWERYCEPGTDLTERNDYVRGSNIGDLILALWGHFYKRPIDTIDTYWGNCLPKLRARFFECPWHEVYDFIEFVANYGPKDTKQRFIEICNINLERENSAYRFVGDQIAEITSDQEIESIEEAIRKATPYSGVRTHLNSALSYLANKTSPDYRNSIKEAISAVESLAKQLGKDESATLGVVLKQLERDKKLHPALKNAFSALYGYTSDADGIRHALLSEDKITKADARFMLVCCSAFVNYVIDTLSA